MIGTKQGADASEGFRKGRGGPAVQQSHGLMGAVVHGHGGPDKILPELDDLYAQGLGKGVFKSFVELLQGRAVLKEVGHKGASYGER